MTTELDAVDTADMKDLQAGNDLALNRLMERHREKIFHYLLRLLQNETDALDLAQETFVRVFQHAASFKISLRFTSWIYSIATNLARDRQRWQARHPNVSMDVEHPESEATLGDLLSSSKPQPDEQLQREEVVTEIKEALAGLPEDLRVPLVLVEYEELSQAEIAQILDCTVKAVENRLYRARKLLRERLSHLFSQERTSPETP